MEPPDDAQPWRKRCLPKYHQIYLVLREQLHEGRFAPGTAGRAGPDAAVRRRARDGAPRAARLAGEGLIARGGRGTPPVTAPAPRRARGTRGRAAAQDHPPHRPAAGNLVSTSLNTTVRVLEVSTVGAHAKSHSAAAGRRRSGAEGGAGALHREGRCRTSPPGCRRTWRALRQARAGEADPGAAGGIRSARRRRPADHLGALADARSPRSSASRSAPRCSRCAASSMTNRAGRCSGCTACTARTATSTSCSCPASATSTPRCGSVARCPRSSH